MTEENSVKNKTRFDFKEYYNTHPEFKQQHLANMRSKIVCAVCGKKISKSNQGHHLNTKRCLKAKLEPKEEITDVSLKLA